MAAMVTVRSHSTVHSYLALGAGLTPNSIRFGHKNFEAGLYPGSLVGLGGILNAEVGTASNMYATFAAGTINLSDVGIYGGVGWEFTSFLICNLRLELGGVGSFRKNYTSGHVLFGLNIGL